VNDAMTEASLEREGALAASRGRDWRSNPYLRREQMPMATGESLRTWARKHDAWQRGFERGTQSDEAAFADLRSRIGGYPG